MTIGAWIYDFTTLKIKFPPSVSAHILGSHKSTYILFVYMFLVPPFYFVWFFLFSFTRVLSAPKL